MEKKNEIHKLLQVNNAKLIRSKKHEVWKLPNGKKFTRSKTPSDHRASDQSLCELRKVLEIKSVSSIGERRKRRIKNRRDKSHDSTAGFSISRTKSLSQQLLDNETSKRIYESDDRYHWSKFVTDSNIRKIQRE